MYRLTIFLLISCVVNRQLIGAVRGGESLSGRNNIYFDSYEHGYPEGEEEEEEEEEEFESEFRGAILMHPEEVIDIPLTPDERDYEMSEFRNDTSLDDYRDARPEIKGKFLQQTQLDFGKLPSGTVDQGHDQMVNMPIMYYLDDSLHDTYKKIIKSLIDVIEGNTCVQFVQENKSPTFVVYGELSCNSRVDGNKIIVGQYCFHSFALTNSIFGMTKLCDRIPMLKAKSDLFRSSFRKKAEEDKCVDKLSSCNRWAKNGGCSSFFHIMSILCRRSCHLCGDSRVDYGFECVAKDTVKDCVLNFNKKRFSCAGTCGICTFSFPDRCVDKIHDCEWLAKKGYCRKFPDKMKEYCPESCGYCKQLYCADERSDCSELEKVGDCYKIPGLMQNCLKTCKFCREGVDNWNKPGDTCIPNSEFVSNYCI